MKTINTMKSLEKFKQSAMLLAVFAVFTLTSCEGDDAIPEIEHEHEVITDVKLIFTPVGDGAVVTAAAHDHDGEGVEELEVEGPINLVANTIYNLTFEIENNLEHDDHEEEGEEEEGEEHEEHGVDIAAEIKEEAEEHQLFFAFTNDAFLSPTGNGNIDNSADQINYMDFDANQRPLGLETLWSAGSGTQAGKFRVVLVHQPDIKSATSGANDGDADFDIEFELNIQ